MIPRSERGTSILGYLVSLLFLVFCKGSPDQSILSHILRSFTPHDILEAKVFSSSGPGLPAKRPHRQKPSQTFLKRLTNRLPGHYRSAIQSELNNPSFLRLYICLYSSQSLSLYICWIGGLVLATTKKHKPEPTFNPPRSSDCALV